MTPIKTSIKSKSSSLSASSSGSTSTHKRFVTPSHDQPSLETLDTFVEPCDSPPAKGSIAVARPSVTVSTITEVSHDAKAA